MKILFPLLVEEPRTIDTNPEVSGKHFRGLDFANFLSQDVPAKGVLIAIEGIDGSGKTSLAYGLSRALSGVFGESVVLTAEPAQYFREGLSFIDMENPVDPGDCDAYPCPVTDSYQRRLEALRLSMDHAIHMGQVVIPALLKGMIVITDRWYWSSFCYQVERLAEVGDPAPELFISSSHQGWDLVPDVTLYLTLPVEEAMRRIQARTKETGNRPHLYEQEDFLRRVAARYARLAAEEENGFITLDGLSSQDILMNQAMDAAMNRVLARRGRG